jgi:small subunit ribosomal protein S21
MLIVDARDTDSIDKALKKYKKKFEKAGVLRELRKRQNYVKPSVERRHELLKAQHREKMRQKESSE